VHVMAGLVPAGADRDERLVVYRGNLGWAAKSAADRGVDVLIEPINQRDMPGYLLSLQDEAHQIVREIGAPNLKVQLDLYHCQITEGDLTMRLRSDLPTGRVGHLQIAGVPDRHEPDGGELAIDHLFAVIDEVGFDGWVGCEYRPAAGTSEGLEWMK
jgi:hydroxypyruvate isomerase